MKQFAIVFLAVLCAIVVSVVGLVYAGRWNAWRAETTTKRDDLFSAQARLDDHRNELEAILADASGSKRQANDLRLMTQSDAAEVASFKIELLTLYSRKPFFLSVKEKQQAGQWGRELDAYKHERTQTTAVP